MPKAKSLTELRQLGPVLPKWLNAVGVRSRIDLERLGAVTVYKLLKDRGYRTRLNMVYVLEGALRDVGWRRLPAARRAALRHAARQALKPRCPWAGSDPLYQRYHDEEWGVPVHDDRTLFEFLTLEGAQAGLSWITILRKRAAYRAAFAGFDPARVARFDRRRVQRLLHDPGIVRHRLKIESTVSNARAFLAVQREFGSFDRYLWGFVGGRPIVTRRRSLMQVPARSVESDRLSEDLRRRGFRFVGSTICYALMQAVGLVDDHIDGCFKARRR
jgi:DNA-3-methyladenine glycosylase I